tara:strand:+ start:4264 stop:4770 length:507 start_codon:yes stop_codon:yes gene_type:complete
MKKIHNINFFIFFICFTFLKSQSEDNKLQPFEDFQMSNERYVPTGDGKFYIKVNIWGSVGKAGVIQVYDGIDLASLLSLVGGPDEKANLKKVKLYREKPDENGQLVYMINLDHFVKTGDRSKFIKIKPNDTIIVPAKLSMVVIQQIGTINTLFSLLSLYIQLNSLFSS